MMLVKAGSTDVTTYFHLRLAASGADATGLTITNIDLQYTRSGVAPTAKVDATALAATDSAHGDNQAIEIDATDQPGLYRVDWPDAAFAAGVREVLLTVKVATAFTETLRVQITGFDPSDGVRAGLTALPNAAAEAAGGLFTRGTGAGQINQAANGMIDTNPVRLNNVSQSLLDLKDFADDGYDPATNKVQGVVLTDTVTTYTGNTPQTGDAFARLGAPAGASVSADIAAIEAQTDDIGAAGAGLTAIPWNAAWDAEVESECNDALIAQNLDHLVKSAVDTNFATTVHLDSVIGQLADDGTTATFDRTTDSLESIRNKETDIETDTQDIQTKIGTPAGASVSADIAAIEAQTDDIGIAGAGLTAVPWNAAWDAEVQSEVEDALVAHRLDELLNADSDIDGAAPPTVGSVFHELMTKTTGSFTYDQTTDSLEALKDGASAPTVGQIADAVWDETLADHLGVGSTGSALNAAGSAGDPWNTALPGAYGAGTAGKIIGDNINATVSSRATQTSVDDLPTNAELATSQAAADDATLAAIAALNNISAADVWSAGTRTLTAFDAAFKTGYALSSAGVQAIWDALTSALTTVGSIGKLLVDNINATISSRSTQTSVDDLPTNAELATSQAAADDATLAAIAALNNLSQADIRTAVGLGSANLDTQLGDLPTNAELATALAAADDAVLAAIAALNNLSAAQVNAEVLDVLNVDTFAQPGQGTPAATTSIRLMLAYLYKAWRNRTTQTASQYSLMNDDAVTVDQKSTFADDGSTADRGEIATGP